MSYEKNRTVIVDMQFAVGNNLEYLAKEFVFMFLNSATPRQYHFAPPFPQHELTVQAAAQNNFNLRNINGLGWSDGNVPYDVLESLICKLAEFIIIVKGRAKRLFLLNVIPNARIIDLDSEFRLSDYIRKPYIDCVIHRKRNLRCSIEHVHAIYNYLNKNYELC